MGLAGTAPAPLPRMPVVVGIANTNEDIIDLLRLVMEKEGFAAAAIHLVDIKNGRSDFNDFIEQHDPAAIIFDIPPPYDDNWTFVSTLRRLPSMERRGVVITTTHTAHLERLVGESTGAVEIIGKPNDTYDVVEAVKRELRRVGKLDLIGWAASKGPLSGLI
jgi:DNA-binding response OmpR family regulator